MKNVIKVDLRTWQKHILTGVDGSCSRLDLNLCFNSGQTFSWKSLSPGLWANILDKELLVVSQFDSGDHSGEHRTESVANHLSRPVYFWVPPSNDGEIRRIREKLKNYFQLNVKADELYNQWHQYAPELFPLVETPIRGIRLLKQPPFESLLSFICSQNNVISRITKMVLRLKEDFGDYHVDIFVDSTPGCTRISSFPAPEDLKHENVVETLRGAGFGYRADYIQQTSKLIAQEEFDLNGLVSPVSATTALPNEEKYPLAHDDAYSNACVLLKSKLFGVGPKVADCVALTGLGYTQAVPVDTHIRQLARNISQFAGDSVIHRDSKTLTSTQYQHINSRFRSLLGMYAGWAHLLLFANQLNKKSAGNAGATGEANPVGKKSKTRRKRPVDEEAGSAVCSLKTEAIQVEGRASKVARNGKEK